MILSTTVTEVVILSNHTTCRLPASHDTSHKDIKRLIGHSGLGAQSFDLCVKMYLFVNLSQQQKTTSWIIFFSISSLPYPK
jgi:hypothetical protein